MTEPPPAPLSWAQRLKLVFNIDITRVRSPLPALRWATPRHRKRHQPDPIRKILNTPSSVPRPACRQHAQCHTRHSLISSPNTLEDSTTDIPAHPYSELSLSLVAKPPSSACEIPTRGIIQPHLNNNSHPSRIQRHSEQSTKTPVIPPKPRHDASTVVDGDRLAWADIPSEMQEIDCEIVRGRIEPTRAPFSHWALVPTTILNSNVS